jgi:sialic acid synthase SpsE
MEVKMKKEVYIIAEMGINHNGKISEAKLLIDSAARSGVNAIKFQYRNLHRAYTPSKKEIGDEILFSEIERNFLNTQSILKLTTYAKSLNLEVGISFFIKDDIGDFKKSINVFDFFKIPSVELQNLDLINSLLKFKKNVFISTGAHNEIEIQRTLEKLNPNDPWFPFHCVSNYPTAIFNSKLGYINFLKKKWNKHVGFSSHEPNHLACVAAMAFGVKWIERHITIDKNSEGLDHTSSSTEKEFNELVQFAKYSEFVFSGNSRRICNQGELINKQNLGRSYYFSKDIKAGNFLKEKDIVYRAPLVGYSLSDKSFILKNTLVEDAFSGNPVSEYYFINRAKITNKKIAKLSDKKISLPVRFHDFQEVSKLFPLRNFELHLSFTELLSDFNYSMFSKNHDYSIHLPDYISPTQLIDPFSKNKEVKNRSLLIIKNASKLATFLSKLTRKKIVLVSSISNIEKYPKDEFYNLCANLQKKNSTKNSLFTFQILPPFAWYFGGSYPIDVFSSPEDFSRIASLNLKITLDLSHLLLSCYFYNLNIRSALELLIPHTQHIHLSFAKGFDGEGADFSGLNKEEITILNELMNYPSAKVIEVWQGHLNRYKGFFQALNTLGSIL